MHARVPTAREGKEAWPRALNLFLPGDSIPQIRHTYSYEHSDREGIECLHWPARWMITKALYTRSRVKQERKKTRKSTSSSFLISTRSLVVLHGHVLAPNSLAPQGPHKWWWGGGGENGSRPIGWPGFGRQTLDPRREMGSVLGGTPALGSDLLGVAFVMRTKRLFGAVFGASLSITGQDLQVSKSTRLHVDIFRFFFNKLRYNV